MACPTTSGFTFDAQKQPTPAHVVRLREVTQLSQTAIGEHIGVTKSAWSHYETGRRDMPLESWQLLLHRLGIVPIPFIKRGPVASNVRA